MEIVLAVIGILILINIVGFLLGAVGAVFRFVREHVLLTIFLFLASPSIIGAVTAAISGRVEPEIIINLYAFRIASIGGWILFFWLVWQLIMRVRVAIWLNYTVFGEAEDFPGGERSLEKELKAGTVRRIEYIYVISALFLTKYYDKYKALLDSQGAATPKQLAEICAQNSEKLKSSEELLKAVLYNMVSNGDAKEVALDRENAIREGTGYPLFISEHPAMSSNFVRREISLD